MVFENFIKLLKMESFNRFSLKKNNTKNKLCKYTTKNEYMVISKNLKKNSWIMGSTRSFCSGNVKLKANAYESIKDLTSNLQAEASADAARRITRRPNPNRIECLVRRIYTIYREGDLDAKIDKMNDLLLENIWTENQEMGDRAKVALEKMLRNEILQGEEAFYVDNFFINEGISLEGLRLSDLRFKIETCQDFYTQKYSELQEKLNEWNEEKNNLLLQQEEEELNKEKGKEPDYSLHPSYNISEDINSDNITQKEDIKPGNLKNSQILFRQTDSSEQKEFCGNDELNLNNLANKRKFSDLNGTDLCDEGKIIKKAKITHNTSLLDDYADISCEPLDIIDFDG